MSPPIDHQHPVHEDDLELTLSGDEIPCGGHGSDEVNVRALVKASSQPASRCKCGDKSQPLRSWCTSDGHAIFRKSCRREKHGKQTRGVATGTTETTDWRDIPFQHHDDTSRYIQEYRENRAAAMAEDDAIDTSNHVASSMSFNWPLLATCNKHFDLPPNKSNAMKVRPLRRQTSKFGSLFNRKAVSMKECNGLEGLPKKTFLLCAEQMLLTSESMNKSTEETELSHPGKCTDIPVDRKQATGTNGIGQTPESLEQNDDTNSLDDEQGDIAATTHTTPACPIPVSMLPKMNAAPTIVPLQLGVNACELLTSELAEVSVKKKRKRKAAKQLCCLQQQYMDLSLPKLKPHWSLNQPVQANKVTRHCLRKRHILRLSSLPSTACDSSLACDDGGDVSLPYLTQRRSCTEFRLARSSKTDTNSVKRSIVLSKLSSSQNDERHLPVTENLAHISKCELFTTYNT